MKTKIPRDIEIHRAIVAEIRQTRIELQAELTRLQIVEEYHAQAVADLSPPAPILGETFCGGGGGAGGWAEGSHGGPSGATGVGYGYDGAPPTANTPFATIAERPAYIYSMGGDESKGLWYIYSPALEGSSGPGVTLNENGIWGYNTTTFLSKQAAVNCIMRHCRSEDNPVNERGPAAGYK